MIGAKARFMQGEIQFLRQDYDAAIRTFFKVAYGYGHPKSPQEFHEWQANAMFEAARCCESTKRLEAAQQLYNELIETHPDCDKAAMPAASSRPSLNSNRPTVNTQQKHFAPNTTSAELCFTRTASYLPRCFSRPLP